MLLNYFLTVEVNFCRITTRILEIHDIGHGLNLKIHPKDCKKKKTRNRHSTWPLISRIYGNSVNYLNWIRLDFLCFLRNGENIDMHNCWFVFKRGIRHSKLQRN